MLVYVGVTGKARQGKSSFCSDFLKAAREKDLRGMSFLMTPISQPMKDMWFGSIIGCQNQRDMESLKDVPYDMLGVRHRQVLESLGDWGRSIHPHFWIHAIERHVTITYPMDRVGTVVLVPDVRFDAEAEWIRDKGGTIVHVHGNLPGIDSTHSVESNPVTIQAGDTVIRNTGTRDDLYTIASQYLTDLLQEKNPT